MTNARNGLIDLGAVTLHSPTRRVMSSVASLTINLHCNLPKMLHDIDLIYWTSPNFSFFA